MFVHPWWWKSIQGFLPSAVVQLGILLCKPVMFDVLRSYLNDYCEVKPAMEVSELFLRQLKVQAKTYRHVKQAVKGLSQGMVCKVMALSWTPLNHHWYHYARFILIAVQPAFQLLHLNVLSSLVLPIPPQLNQLNPDGFEAFSSPGFCVIQIPSVQPLQCRLMNLCKGWKWTSSREWIAVQLRKLRRVLSLIQA